MRSLLDVNLLIALTDKNHAFNDRAVEWLSENSKEGWASCPLTENAVLRIMTNPGYSRSTTFNFDLIQRLLREFIRNIDHQFWPDDVSLLDPLHFNHDLILGPGQLTDLYLLALAVKNEGRLGTFDSRISISSVTNATAVNLCVIGT